jgi:hypothetical protein
MGGILSSLESREGDNLSVVDDHSRGKSKVSSWDVARRHGLL